MPFDDEVAVARNSSWSNVDWNGDGEFDSGDVIDAFGAGGYEAGTRAAVSAVPEPAAMVMFLTGLLGLAFRRR